jgi:sulfate transport system ATP-binding protein
LELIDVSILIDNISKKFGNFQALNHINLEIKSGSIIALLGPSGSGKSTLLRIIAGLDTPDEGTIWISGKNASGYSIQSRNIGFVFQNYALFKNMTVYDNIAFGLELRRISFNDISRKVNKLLELVQLQNLGHRYPAQLSGGQRQRIALARALAIEPKVLLLDEPFGALDARVRKNLRAWLRDLHNKFSITTIIVTHDQQEAMEIADEIVVFNAGRIEQIGKPQDIYDQPATPFVFSLLGYVNKISFDNEIANFLLSSFPEKQSVLMQEKQFYIRPHQIVISKQSNESNYSAKIENLLYIGNWIHLDIYVASFNVNLKVHVSPKEFDNLQLKSFQENIYVSLRSKGKEPIRFLE